MRVSAMAKSHLPIWSADQPLLDQIQPHVPDGLQPPIHFTHVLGPLLRKEQHTFDDTKTCNNEFYDIILNDTVTPLSFLLGYNVEHVVYHEAVAKLVYHPNLYLKTECNKNLYFYLVRFPSEDNINIIKMLCAFRVNLLEDDLTNLLEEFSKNEFRFNDTCKRELAVQALAEMLQTPLKIKYKEPAAHRTTPLLAALRIPTVGEEKINPFAHQVLQEIRRQIIKKIILEEIQTEQELNGIAIRMVGDLLDKNYQQASMLLTAVIEELKPCLKMEAPQCDDPLLSLIDPKKRMQERKEYTIIKSAIDQENLSLAYHVMDVVNYDAPEFILNYIIKKNNDNLYSFVHALFKLELGGLVSNKFIGRKLSKFNKKLPKISHALFMELLSYSESFVDEFKDAHPELSYSEDRDQWMFKYINFLKEFLDLNDLQEQHWRFLKRNSMRHVIDSVAMTNLPYEDLRDYVYYIYENQEYQKVLAVIQQMEKLHNRQLSLEFLLLLSRTNHLLHMSKEQKPIQQINFLIEEVCCFLKCELICPTFIGTEEYVISHEAIIDILEDSKFKQNEDKILYDNELRVMVTKLNTFGELFLNRKNQKSKLIFPLVATLLAAITKPNVQDKRAIAVCNLNHALTESESTGLRIQFYKEAIQSYGTFVKEGCDITLVDANNIYSIIIQIIEHYKNDQILSVPYCDLFIQMLSKRNSKQNVIVQDLLINLADELIKLCNILTANLNGKKANPEFNASMAILTIRAWTCMKDINWKKIKILSEIHLDKLQPDQDHQRFLLADLNYFCGIAYQNLDDLEKANTHLTAANGLSKGALTEKLSEYAYAHAECLYSRVKKNNDGTDVDHYLDKAYEYLKMKTDDCPFFKAKQMTLLMKIYFEKIKHHHLDARQIECFKKDMMEAATIYGYFPGLLSVYIEANIQMGLLTQCEEYFTDAIDCNPLKKKYLSTSTDSNLTDEDKEYILQLARAYRGYIGCNHKAYTNQLMINIITLLKVINHPSKEDELIRCQIIYDRWSQAFALKQALEEKESKLKCELKLVSPSPVTVSPKTQPKQMPRAKIYGHGTPAIDTILQNNSPKKPNPGPRDPERKKQNDALTFNLRKKAERRDKENARLKNSLQKRREQKNIRAEQVLAKMKLEEEARLAKEATEVAETVHGLTKRLRWFHEGGYHCPMRFFDNTSDLMANDAKQVPDPTLLTAKILL